MLTGKNAGNTPSTAPPAVATPLPPRNPVHTGKMCPAIAAVAAAYGRGVAHQRRARRARRPSPCRRRASTTTMPQPLPTSRNVLNPPGLPLPVSRMSTLPSASRGASRAPRTGSCRAGTRRRRPRRTPTASTPARLSDALPGRRRSRVATRSDVSRRRRPGAGLAGTDPRHHRAQPLADLLDRVRGRLARAAR